MLPGEIAKGLKELHAACQGNLSVQMLGFGEADTTTLDAMAAALPRGVGVVEVVANNNLTTMQTSVSTFSASVTQSRLMSASEEPAGAPQRRLRKVNRAVFGERRELYEVGGHAPAHRAPPRAFTPQAPLHVLSPPTPPHHAPPWSCS